MTIYPVRMRPPIKAPLFLVDLKGWLVWRYVQKPGEKKPRKVPYYVSGHTRSGKQGDVEDRLAMGTYPQAHTMYQEGRFDGIGFAAFEEWGIILLDFDDCIVDGKVIPEVQELIKDTYSEISPSGRGVRAFMRGYLPSRKSPAKDHKFGFETFSNTGYVTVTGNLTDACYLLGMQDTVQELTPEILALYKERFGPGSESPAAMASGDPLMTYVPKLGLTLAELRGYVLQLDPNSSYLEDSPKGVSWLKVGMGIHHETDGDADGLELFDEWSKGSKEKYPGRPAIEAKWRSFSLLPGNTVTARSIVRHVNMEKARKEGKPILDPKSPMGTARAILNSKFMTDDGISLVRCKGLWYEHRGQCYEERAESDLRALVWHYLDRSLKHSPNGGIVPTNPGKSQIDGVLDALKAEANMPEVEPPCWRTGYTGPNPSELVSLDNGLLHIPTRQLLPHTAGLFTLNMLPYGWDANAECTQWHKFLEQVWPGDLESQHTLQEIFGYLLTADTTQQKMFLIVGPRRSGKGTMGRVLSALLGRANVVSPTLTSITGPFGLQPMIDKLVALVPDARVGSQTNVPAIVERLLMVSGEDNITVDRKNRESWSGTMTSRFVFLTNETPQLGDASGALAGRFITLSIRESFYGREDHGLTSRLLTELPGIFRWALDGKDRLHKRGHFLQPQSGEEDAEDLADLGSPISNFIKECCVLGRYEKVVIPDLYAAWRQWCQATGRNQPGTREAFGKLLRAAVPTIRRPQLRIAGDRARFYEGIRLKEEAEL